MTTEYQPNQLYWDDDARRVVKLISKEGKSWNVQLSTGKSTYTAKELASCKSIDCEPRQFAGLLRAEVNFLETLAQRSPSGKRSQINKFGIEFSGRAFR